LRSELADILWRGVPTGPAALAANPVHAFVDLISRY
jgi:hypothetical protein